MAEIIAKSKAFKAEKQRQKEEDQDETAALDDQFRCAAHAQGQGAPLHPGSFAPQRCASSSGSRNESSAPRAYVHMGSARRGSGQTPCGPGPSQIPSEG